MGHFSTLQPFFMYLGTTQHETRTETQQEYQMSYEHTKTVTEVGANDMVREKNVFI